MNEKSQLEIVETEFKKELQVNQKALKALLQTTFKSFTPELMQQAIFEGMMRGFTFKNFLEKDVYAIKYGEGYSLVTSIDYIRKTAMRSGLAGKSAPTFVESKDGVIENCTITIKRSVDGIIGDYTATVYFKEYNTGKNQWASKPHTMIAKVAEMHALRSAFPEEMAKSYIEEEMQREVILVDPLDSKIKEEIDAIKTVAELQEYYKKNKGKGKDFDKYVTAKKKELTKKE